MTCASTTAQTMRQRDLSSGRLAVTHPLIWGKSQGLAAAHPRCFFATEKDVLPSSSSNSPASRGNGMWWTSRDWPWDATNSHLELTFAGWRRLRSHQTRSLPIFTLPKAKLRRTQPCLQTSPLLILRIRCTSTFPHLLRTNGRHRGV